MNIKESFLIGSYAHQNTKFLFIREKTFALTPYLLEELGSSTISHLFRKRLIQTDISNKFHIQALFTFQLVNWIKFTT